jgi:hypothetical protein
MISSIDPVLRVNVDRNPGKPGGPVVDPGVRVVGVAFSSGRATGHGLAVGVSTVVAALRDTAGLREPGPGRG